MRNRRAEYDDPATTFPGAGWYPPDVSAAATITTLDIPEDELEAVRAAEAARKRRGIGFAPRQEDA